MIRRYPCQFAIVLIMGILTGKGMIMGCRAPDTGERQNVSAVLEDHTRHSNTGPVMEPDTVQPEPSVVVSDRMQHDREAAYYGAFVTVSASFFAVMLAGIWIRREKTGYRKLRQTVFLLLAFGTGAARMYTVSNEMQQQLAGLRNDEPVSLQGRIVKKKFKELDTNGQAAYKTACKTNTQISNLYHQVKIESANQFGSQANIRSNPALCQSEERSDAESKCESKLSSEFLSSKFVLSKIVLSKFLSAVPAERQWTVYLTDCYLKTSREIRFLETVILYYSGDEPVIGNTVTVSGNIKLFSTARNEGNFDERSYYQNQGCALKVYADAESYRVLESSTDVVREFLYSIQQRLLQVYENGMPQEAAGALCAMLIGDKSLLLGETKELYQQSGISHILAISGLHISILGMAVYRLLRKRGASFLSAGIISAGLLVLFSFMTGMGISTMRAVIMFALYLGAACCGRAYDSVNGLAAAAIFLLLQNPRALFLAGFQFSFAAVAGVLFGKKLCSIWKPKFRLMETIYISFGIQMLTLPLTAWYYFEIPVYSLWLNMLVLPFMEFVLVTGAAGGGIGVLAGGAAVSARSGIQAAGWFCGYVSRGLLYVCTMFLQYFSAIGSAFLQLPGAVYVIGRPQVWKMAGYFCMLLWCIWRLSYLDLRAFREETHGKGTHKKGTYGKETGRSNIGKRMH